MHNQLYSAYGVIALNYYKFIEIRQIMSEHAGKNFPDWQNLYKNQSVETMPWYNENFDSDLEMELDERKIIANGGKKNSLTLVPVRQLRLYGSPKEALTLLVLIYLKLQLIEQERYMLMKKC